MRKTKYTKKRIESILAKVLKKLNSNLVILVEKGSPELFEMPDTYQNTFFAITTSGRGPEDSTSFVLYYNEDNLAELTLAQIKTKLLHEIIHAYSFNLYNKIEQLLTYVKNKPLQQELDKTTHEICEDITYKLERMFAPFVFPETKGIKEQ